MFLQYPSGRTAPIGGRILNGAMAGSLVALLAVSVAVVRALVLLAAGKKVELDGLFPSILWYVGAFVVGGALVGLLWPSSESRVRRAFVFIAGMSVVMGAIWIMEEGSPAAWAAFDWLAWCGLSVAFGLAISYGYERRSQGSGQPNQRLQRRANRGWGAGQWRMR